MAHCLFHCLAYDIGLFGGFVCLYPTNKKISKPTNEHVSQQDGRAVRELELTEIRQPFKVANVILC